MHIDLETPGLPQRFRARVCIVGAGIAGILLTSRLAAKGVEVHLLEGGGLAFEERSQELYSAQMAGHPHAGATEGRFRTFGGSSTRWGGQLLPYTGDVLHAPAELGLPEWPMTLPEIEPYYEEVQRVLGASLRPFTDDLLSGFGRTQPFTSPDVRLRFSKFAPFTKRNLAKTTGQEILNSSKATLFTHASAVEVETAKDGRTVQAVLAVNDGGTKFRFEADAFVLCLGTIETPRLLLASTGVCPQGVGNCRDQVGRWFHDHLGVAAAEIPGEERDRVIAAFAPFVSEGTLHTSKLEATVDLRRRLGLLSVMAHFPVEEPEDSGAGRVRGVLRAMQRRQFDESFRRSLLGLPGASVEVLRLAWMAKVRHRRALSKRAKISLHIDCEQRPDAESRIRLSEERDRLGMRKAVVDWKISEDEHRTVREYAEVIDTLLRAAGLAKVQWHPELREPGRAWLSRTTDTYHMMGGARMGIDPASSVVDGSLKMHGVENLHIASCATFPTGGSSNPTFTLMALTLRLKDRLLSQLSS